MGVKDVTRHRAVLPQEEGPGDASCSEDDSLFEEEDGPPGTLRVKSHDSLLAFDWTSKSCICTLASVVGLIVTIAACAGTLHGRHHVRSELADFHPIERTTHAGVVDVHTAGGPHDPTQQKPPRPHLKKQAELQEAQATTAEAHFAVPLTPPTTKAPPKLAAQPQEHGAMHQKPPPKAQPKPAAQPEARPPSKYPPKPVQGPAHAKPLPGEVEAKAAAPAQMKPPPPKAVAKPKAPPEAKADVQPLPRAHSVHKDVPPLPRPSERLVCIRPGLCPLLMLFEHAEVLETTVNNMMAVGRKFLGPNDRALAEEVVKMVFNNISTQLKISAPSVASELLQIDLSQRELVGVRELMGFMIDERVQSLGLDVAATIRDNPKVKSRAELRKLIEAKMLPRIEEILGLRTEVPAVLRSIWREVGAENEQWRMTLDPQMIQSMQKISGDVILQYVPSGFPDYEKKYLALTGGALEEGRALVDILQKCIRSMGAEWTTDIGATMLFQVAPLEWPCEYSSGQANSHIDYIKALRCPLKFGALGMDVIRAAEVMALPDTQ